MTVKNKKKRKSNAAKQKKIRIAVLTSLLTIFVVMPLMLIFLLWWWGMLPTREELPRFKDRLYVLIHGWEHPQLPEADIIGIDISHYQLNVDFEDLQFHLDKKRQMHSNSTSKTYTRPVDFVIAKATEGGNMQDSHYARNKQGCRENNILFGAYHFYSIQASARQQANNFIHFSQLQKGDFVPVLDVEPVNNKFPSRDSIYKWIQLVEDYYDVHPIIYTNERSYRDYFHSDKRFHQYSFWIARYGVFEPSKHHIMWQCTQNGRVGGISGPVDVNIFKGTKADLEMFKIR